MIALGIITLFFLTTIIVYLFYTAKKHDEPILVIPSFLLLPSIIQISLSLFGHGSLALGIIAIVVMGLVTLVSLLFFTAAVMSEEPMPAIALIYAISVFTISIVHVSMTL